MVLDAKALTWAAKNNIDTAKLKAARVPIYGKWYYPEIPAGVVLVNLETGEQDVFSERMIAGEVIFVPAAELVRANLAPAEFAIRQVPGGEAPTTGGALRTIAPEPLLAMARPPGYGLTDSLEPLDSDGALVDDLPAELAGIHMPSASIAPFVLAVGFCLLLMGLVTHPIIVIAGLAWMFAGAVAWVRIGVMEARAAALHGHVSQADDLEVEPVA